MSQQQRLKTNWNAFLALLLSKTPMFRIPVYRLKSQPSKFYKNLRLIFQTHFRVMCKTLSCQAVTATYRLGADSQETYYYAKRGQLIYLICQC